MGRLLTILVLISSLSFSAEIAEGQSASPEQGLAMRDGDWILLCDNHNSCAIRGIVEHADPANLTRALVMFDRTADAGAKWYGRLAFMDDDGQEKAIREPLPDDLNLIAFGGTVPLPLALISRAGNPIQELPLDDMPGVMSLLAQNAQTSIRAGTTGFAVMPRGDLPGLLSAAEQRQQTLGLTGQPDDAEDNGGDRYFLNFYVAEDQGASLEPRLEQPCGADNPIQSRTWQLHMGARLWIVDCSDEAKIFHQLRHGSVEQIEPADVGLEQIRPGDADFDGVTGILSLHRRLQDRKDCGERHWWGVGDDDAFIPILVKSMPLCRNVPASYWPISWEQDDWRVLGSSLDHSSQ